MDRLARESTEAIKAGMSYGKWKALQYEKQKKAALKVEPKEESEDMAKCVYCGAPFYRTRKDRIYCSRNCCSKANHERYSPSKVCKKVCVVCGKEFEANRNTAKYCSKECYTIVHKEMIRRNKERKKGENAE